MEIIVHADDFGIEVGQSRRILECCGMPGEPGALNSLSVFSTSPAFDECAALLDGRPGHLRIGVHVNLTEGPCCADPSEVASLVDDDGVFALSFVGLLQRSLSGDRERFERELRIEVAAQIRRFVRRFPETRGALRIDGHQHVQLIPSVFSAVRGAAADCGCVVSSMRVPAESTAAYLDPRVLFGIRPVNWAKHWVLDALWAADRRRWPDARQAADFCGVLFSGGMSEKRVLEVLPALARRARSHGRDLELLFHPGRVDDPRLCLNPNIRDFVEFSTSENRSMEACALKRLRTVEEGDGLALA